MTLAASIESALEEHLNDFVKWMADGWMMTDKDREDSIINDLPDDPAKAYQMGYNAGCEGVESAYQCYCEDIEH